MIGFLLIAGASAAELGAQLTLESQHPLALTTLYPTIENNMKFYVKLSNLHVGLLLSSAHHNGMYYEQQEDEGCEALATCTQGDTWIGGIGPYVSYDIQLTSFSVAPYLALKAGRAPLLANKEYVQQDFSAGLPAINNYLVIPSAQVGADVRLPIFSKTSGIAVTAGAEYMLGVDLFYQFGLGVYLH